MPSCLARATASVVVPMFRSTDTPSGDGDNPAESSEAHRGYSNMTQEEVETWLKRCDEANIQIQAHTNGEQPPNWERLVDPPSDDTVVNDMEVDFS